MKAAIKPQQVPFVRFDGVDDYFSSDNSGNVGSAYDIERTDVFSMGVAFNMTKSSTPQTDNIFFSKRQGNTGIGYFFEIDSLQLRAGFIYSGNFGSISSNVNMVTLGSIFYIVLTYDGTSSVNGLTIYFYNVNATLLGVFSVANGNAIVLGTASIPSTIKNTGSLLFGSNTISFFQGAQWHHSIFNVTLTSTEAQELATRMVNNSVGSHSRYDSNCTGYWRDYLPKVKLINHKNQFYNSSPINF
jgi:hypothetical protein